MHRCYTCHRSYKRIEQLKRHEETHNILNRTCRQCFRTFSRNDALTRHLKTCGEIGKPSKRKSCDNCVRLKRACDLVQPCGTCLQRNMVCTFPIDIDINFLDLANTSWNEFLTLLEPSTPTLPFLDNFTKRTGLIQSFDCGSDELRDVVSKQMPAISQELIHVHCIIIELIDDFFDLKDCARLLEMYWSLWHPNVNLLHRPTFHLTNSVLVAAMVVIGRCGRYWNPTTDNKRCCCITDRTGSSFWTIIIRQS